MAAWVSLLHPCGAPGLRATAPEAWCSGRRDRLRAFRKSTRAQTVPGGWPQSLAVERCGPEPLPFGALNSFAFVCFSL